MSAVPQVTLADNQAFLLNVGYLAIINGRGPFGSSNLHQAINGWKVRETWADAVVGDYVYTGNEWGKVKAKTGDNTVGWALTVTFDRTVLPAGIDHATWNPVRDEIYTSQLPAADAASGLANTNAWQNLSSVGIVVCAPVGGGVAATVPNIVLDATPVIQQGVTPFTVDTDTAGASIQPQVGGVNSGSPVVADGSGVGSIAHAFTAGQSITFVVSAAGKATMTFGPFIVAAP